MESICPYCAGNETKGCGACIDGKVDVSVAEGAVYTARCTNPECGKPTGMRIVGEKTPPLPPEGLDDAGNVLACVWCEHEAEWDLVGWSGSDA